MAWDVRQKTLLSLTQAMRTFECSIRKPIGLDNYVVHSAVRDCNINQTGVLSFDLPFYTDDEKRLEAFIRERLCFGVEILKQKLVMTVISLEDCAMGKKTMILPLKNTAGLLTNMRLFFFDSAEVYAGAEPLSAPDGPYYQGIITNLDEENIYVQMKPSIDNVKNFQTVAKYAAIR